MMNANATDSTSKGMQARRRARVFRSQSARRGGILATALSAAALAASCMPYIPPPSVPIEMLSTGDAVVVVWMEHGRSVSGLAKGSGDTAIALLNAQGKPTVSYLDDSSVDPLLWTENGLSFGVNNENFLTTEKGTRRTPRPGFRTTEDKRYALPDGRIAVLGGAKYTGNQVDTIELDGSTTSVKTAETSGDVGQCGSRILAITDTQESESIKGSAREAYAAQSGSQTDVPEELAAVVQLNDAVGDEPRVLAVAPMIEGLKSGQFMFACEGDVITMPSVLQDDPVAARNFGVDATTGPMVLQRWDLSTGQRTVIPAFDENGNEITLSKDLTIFGYQAVQVGDEYRFISRRGHAFTVNLRSGQARHLFTIPAETASHRTLFQVTETGVYVLEDRYREHLVTISYRPWDGGDLREVITTGQLEKYLRTNAGGILSSGQEREIENFALRPGWDGGAR